MELVRENWDGGPVATDGPRELPVAKNDTKIESRRGRDLSATALILRGREGVRQDRRAAVPLRMHGHYCGGMLLGVVLVAGGGVVRGAAGVCVVLG